MTGHDLWNRHFRRYDQQWGSDRSNETERTATIAHETDHWDSWERVESFLNRLNSLEGKVFSDCSRMASGLTQKLSTLINETKEMSSRYDTVPGMNQGGIGR